MTPQDIFSNQNIYFGQETIGEIPCTIGYIKKFKWSWFGTQLNTFVIIGKAQGKIDRKLVEEFSGWCFEYARKNNKGWPRGIQSAVGSIAILQGADISDDAKSFCVNFSKKHWSAFEIPVLYNTSSKKTIRFTNKPLWGAIYFSFFTKTIDSITSQL